MNELTHASFFSGVGGTDLGLERASWRTVSFSEIDPYACAVLAKRWPGVANLGDIVRLSDERIWGGDRGNGAPADGEQRTSQQSNHWRRATLWSGGFPCQDLSVAGKRAGFAGERSVLAFAFLALVERHRPPAILLENVPGLLSSHGGRDMAALIGRMVELGYGVAYRVLDAQHFGVPQRRRRVFILGLRSDPDDADGRVAAERAAEVLSVGTRCGRHPATGHEKGQGVASSPELGVGAVGSLKVGPRQGWRIDAEEAADGRLIFNATARFGGWREDSIAGNLSQRDYKSSNHLISTPPDADGMRAPDGLAGRAHDSGGVAFNPYRTLEKDGSVTSGYAERPVVDALHGPTGNKEPLITQSLPTQRVGTDDNDAQGGFIVEASGMSDDPLLPLGLDSHRYRCAGNGVVAPVAEWLGLRLAEALA